MNEPVNTGKPGKKRRRRPRRRRDQHRQPTESQAQPEAPETAVPKPDGRQILVTIPERHAVIIDWLAEIQGKTPEVVCSEMVRSAAIRDQTGYREAHGAISSTTRKAQPTG